MAASPRLSLPFLSPGQAQKEMYHNEALQLLDALVGACVEEGPRSAPPASPIPGQCYIVGVSPSGAWIGKETAIAAYTSGGWRFIAPFEGLSVHVKSLGVPACFRSGQWDIGAIHASAVMVGGQQVVGARGAAIASPAGGQSVDAEARACVGQILAALRQHGLIAT